MPSYEACNSLSRSGLNTSCINLRVIKPLDTATLLPLISSAKVIIVVEEGCAIGGVFHYLKDQLSHSCDASVIWKQIALPDEFVDHGQILFEKSNLSDRI